MQAAGDAAPPGARLVAWAGTLVFFASLAYFLFSFATEWGQPAPEGSPAWRGVAVDSALFTLFALHHSVFAREPFRRLVARVVSPMLERSLYVWVASALFIAVCALWQPVPGIAWDATGPLRWTLVALQAAGIWLTLRSAMMIDVFELSGVRQLTPKRGATEFKASGPYGWMRHPIYTGWMLMVFCAPAMTMTRLVFAIISSVYLLLAIPFEERSLLATSGEAYGRYARQVRWKLFPGLY